jgi:tRNA A-37 threonylcarbamoyl transferase component Bud32/tetratricopeptide (TPR) repeat protein
MWIATASLPAALASELAAGRFAQLADLGGDDAATAFARGLALSHLGRTREARESLQKVSPPLRDAAAVELGFLDLNTPEGPATVATKMTAFLKDNSENSLLGARASHLLGTAQFRRMRAGDALDALTLAQQSYHSLGCEPGEAQVFDTLGMVHQWMGNETAALVSYAHSLALKTRLGDGVGSAITLGNLGRYCAMLGRPAEASGFLILDLKIAEETGDARGEARVLSDLAEIARDTGDVAGAKEKLSKAQAIARDGGLTQLQFEIELTFASLGNGVEETQHLAEARRIVGANPTGFDKLLLDWREAKVIAATDRPRATALLNDAASGFRDADIPALEIDARLALADLLLTGGERPQAERETLVSLKRARERNLPRYRVRIGELMEQLSLVEGVAEESGKAIDDKASGTVDGYVVRERLGGGAFATVYRAFDVERAREVALKVFDLESRYERKERDRIMDSARLDMEAANRARHPGLVKVFAIGRDTRGNAYLAVEYIAGTALRDRLDGTPARDTKLVCSMLADVAEALAALHAEGVVHRDLKPENIMLRPDGSPVIVDFGIAHIAGAQAKVGAISRGTPEYFSPEQARGEPSTPADDIFSFGVILWEWLNGARPDAAHPPQHKTSLFGGRAAPKSAQELAGTLLDPRAANRPTASEAAALLRSFAA